MRSNATCGRDFALEDGFKYSSYEMRPKIEEAGTIGLIARLPDIGNLSPADGDIADGIIAGGMIANTKYKICPRWINRLN